MTGGNNNSDGGYIMELVFGMYIMTGFILMWVDRDRKSASQKRKVKQIDFKLERRPVETIRQDNVIYCDFSSKKIV